MIAFLFATFLTLTPTRPEPRWPANWQVELSPEEETSFARASDWVLLVNNRRLLWSNFLNTMNWKESQPSRAGVRFVLTIGDRIFSFDAFGHYWMDSRFLRDDEEAQVKAYEDWFRQLVAVSPYADFVFEEAKGETMGFRGYEDAIYASRDLLFQRLAEEFNATRPEGMDELHPRLLKSLVLEENYWNWPEGVDERYVRDVLRRLAEASLDKSGHFTEWFQALKLFDHAWSEDTDYYRTKFAERVNERFQVPEEFVPVLARKGKDE